MTSKYEQDYIITGIVVAIKTYGIFIAIDQKRQGFIHISEISDRYIKNINEYVNIGDVVQARVLSADKKYKNLTLSLKGIITRNTTILKNKTNTEQKIENRKSKIPLETASGFLPLKKMLPLWIINSK